LNYRHHFHAGNFADVLKHALLVLLIRGLQRKPKGLMLLDTHAGRGAYDLAAAEKGDRLPRQPEHPNGIGRVAASARGRPSEAPAALSDYLDLVRSFSPDLARYPGSPWFLRELARPEDRVVLCELHPEECEELRINVGGARPLATFEQGRAAGALGVAKRPIIQEIDGYQALKAQLPPPERRGLVLIDPPFEAADEWDRLMAALAEAMRRFPSGTYALWHPVTERSRSASFWADLASTALPPTWAGRMVVAPDSPGLKGCGLVVINPPWGFEAAANELLADLGRTLGGAIESRWIKPER
jgi:23S rRNA (adenine2030-N6)-methyltransferase